MSEQPRRLDRRVRFDFEIDFSNGGGIQGQGFRLDIDGDDIDDQALADYIVRDLRLLMVGAVRILNKTVIEERHKRAPAETAAASDARRRVLVDLSHAHEHGSAWADRVDTAAGTRLDGPGYHGTHGVEATGPALEDIADLDGVVVRLQGMHGRAIGRSAFAATGVHGKAVLVHTGWDVHWHTPAYLRGYPFLTADAAAWLRDAGARLVGIDSPGIDDGADSRRPTHALLREAGIPVAENLCRLERLPAGGFCFSAVPPAVRGSGSVPVRAWAGIPG